MYSPQVLNHFQHPHNAGDIVPADAFAEVENPACGDVLRLTLKIRDGHIVEARFKAKGCVAAIACGSALTELIAGRHTADVRAINREDIVSLLGGLPQGSSHAAQLAIDALMTALKVGT